MILHSSFSGMGIPSQRMDVYEELISCSGLDDGRKACWLAGVLFLSGDTNISITSNFFVDWRCVLCAGGFFFSSGRLVMGAGVHFAFFNFN